MVLKTRAREALRSEQWSKHERERRKKFDPKDPIRTEKQKPNFALTTSENTKHSANMLESNASFKPIAVVNPTTSAVCDEGIPPLPTNLPQSTFPVVW